MERNSTESVQFVTGEKGVSRRKCFDLVVDERETVALEQPLVYGFGGDGSEVVDVLGDGVDMVPSLTEKRFEVT